MNLMNKMDRKRIIIIAIIVILAAAGLAALIPVGKTIAAAKQILGRLFYAFAYSYRFKIAYVSAVILLAGAFFLVLKKPPAGALASTRHAPPAWNDHWKKLLLVSLLILFLFWAPYLFQGQDIHVKIFDNLDCHIPHTKVLAGSGKTFSLNPDARLDNFINGIRLSGVDSGYNVLTWLFMIFPPFMAYALNELLVRLIAFLGMVLLLRKYVFKGEDPENRWIVMGVSLCFSFLLFYPAGGISTAGIPLLLYAFLNILRREEKISDFLIILIFPFYSKLALAGFFIAAALFILMVIDNIKKKKINLPYIGGLALLTVTYLFTHFHLVYSFIDPTFTSFRHEIETVVWSTSNSLGRTVHNFLFDRVNVCGAQHIFVVGAAAFAAVVSVIAIIKRQTEKIDLRAARLMAALVIGALFTSILWGFKYWKGLVALREKIQLLNAFDFSRFYWLNPFVWYIIFALALLVISKIKYGKIIAAIFILCQIGFMFTNYSPEYRHLLGIKTSFAGSPLTYSLTYGEFYSESLFAQIHRHIDRPKKDYRVISLGMHPGISQYNGFYTLDIYTDVYPLEYKHRFRKILEKEIAKSKELQKVFDGNAKRCFLLVSELHGTSAVRGLAFSRGITKKDQHLKIKNLELNANALKAMGGEYIFSAVEIVNHEENNLKLEGIFRASDSPWKIYLYKVL
jgi:hypothetical protein